MGIQEVVLTKKGSRLARRRSVQTYLTILVLSILIPGILGTAFLLIRDHRKGQAELEASNIQTARALSQTVDSYLMRLESLASTLAVAGLPIHQGNFALFHKNALDVLAQEKLSGNFVLIDRSGQQIVNTLKPFGEPLPRTKNMDVVRRVFDTGRPAISDLMIGTVLSAPVVAISVPVMMNGQVAYVLGLTIKAEKFSDILRQQSLPEDQVAAIFDTKGQVVGRTRDPEKFVGKQAPQPFLDRIKVSREGAVTATALDGTDVISAYSVSPATHWGVSIGTPRHAIEEKLNARLATTGLGLAGIFCLGLWLAWKIGGKIARSFIVLKEPAIALGVGQKVSFHESELKEAAEVSEAMEKAADLLQERSTALQKSEGDLRHLIAAIPGTVWTATRDGAVDFISRQWLDYTGRSMASQLGAGFLDVIHQEDREDLLKTWQEAVTRSENFHAEYRLLRHDGAYRWFKSWGTPILDQNGQCIRWLGVVTDIHNLKGAEEALRRTNADLKNRISEKERAEAELRIAYQHLQDTHEQLIQMEKLSALGTLVGGVAHEINNPLMGIKGYIEYVSDKLDEGRPKEVLQRASAEVDRIGRIVKNMLVFSRSKSSLSFGDVDLVQVVQKTVALVDADLRHQNIELRISAPETPVMARGNMDNIQQAVLNLLLNARDALKQHPLPHKLDISVAYDENAHCFISVTDNGPGIPESIRTRIFDPFFTTKPAGQGTGLGLAVTRQLIEASGGSIDVGTAATGGASFIITVAAAEKAYIE